MQVYSSPVDTLLGGATGSLQNMHDNYLETTGGSTPERPSPSLWPTIVPIVGGEYMA